MLEALRLVIATDFALAGDFRDSLMWHAYREGRLEAFSLARFPSQDGQNKADRVN